MERGTCGWLYGSFEVPRPRSHAAAGYFWRQLFSLYAGCNRIRTPNPTSRLQRTAGHGYAQSACRWHKVRELPQGHKQVRLIHTVGDP